MLEYAVFVINFIRLKYFYSDDDGGIYNHKCEQGYQYSFNHFFNPRNYTKGIIGVQ